MTVFEIGCLPGARVDGDRRAAKRQSAGGRFSGER
jgi:hypothetical protein